ncbi:uncharacterized protein LOC141618485 [Silene latifolia]|uniref:uncharacterized protein LOC141618485 n=1 Tax=Silene latifolia TaxID=37657 RepID=UPI003D77392A
MPKAANATLLVLVPKTDIPSSVVDYRPITGDLPSVVAIASCLDEFVLFRVFFANPLKTCVYFGGVTSNVKGLIMAATGFSEGEFPFRYLGLPLSTSRFTAAMFKPMLDKIRGKIMHWANHTLSYAGKVTLLNSVVFGVQNFWGASILLPKGIVKKLQKICKDFFWGIAEGKRRLVFKKWLDFCLPRREGGMDIKEILSWNKSQMVRWVWKLVYKPDCLWSAWFKHYVLKGPSIWQATSTISHSWFWKSVIATKDMLVHLAGVTKTGEEVLEECTRHGKFQVSQIYHSIRPKGNIVGWWMGHFDPPVLLAQVLHWFSLYNRGAARGKVQRRCLLACTIYVLWKERNDRIFKDKRSDSRGLCRKICYLVATRMYHLA